MSIGAFSSRPEDHDDTSDDDFDDWLDDDEDDDGDDADDEEDEELSVEVIVDRRTSRPIHAFTKGLWLMGIPELCVSPPPTFDLRGQPDERNWGRFAFFLATGLLHLGDELILVEHFEVPHHFGEFEGEPAEMWLAHHEPVEGELAIIMHPEVDTLLRVDCSLWEPSRP